MKDGFADRPLRPLGHPHIVGSLTGFALGPKGRFALQRTCDHQSHNLVLYLLSYKLHDVAGAGFEPASGFWPAQLMRLVSWATTLSRDFAEAEGFEPPTFGFGDRHSTN